MEIGIFGLPLSGKTTLFNLLTRSHAETGFAASKKKVNLGMSQVPDPRVDKLSAIWSPKKTTYATIRYVDVAGEEKGGDQGFSPEMLAHLKNTDALLVVVRAFASDEVPHPDGSVDPVRDVETLASEMLLSDLVIVETRLERLQKALKGKDRDQYLGEQALMERFQQTLEEETPLRALELTDEEHKLVKGYQFLTLKPMIIALNLGEDELDAAEAKVAEVAEQFGSDQVAVTHLCATIEQEISELSAEDAADFLADLRLTDSATDRILRTSYGLLGLISFFTMGEDECRAWTITEGTKAPAAAGAIHSDLERGFIRAEVVHYDDFAEAGSTATCRDKGLLRLEGKEYVVVDGDILNIRFSV